MPTQKPGSGPVLQTGAPQPEQVRLVAEVAHDAVAPLRGHAQQQRRRRERTLEDERRVPQTHPLRASTLRGRTTWPTTEEGR